MINNDEVIQQIAQEETLALGHYTAQLSTARANALDRFYGRPVGRLASPGEGRSSYVSSDVADTINGIMPSLMKIFMSGDEVLQFNPISQMDVKQAEQETDYVNHVVTQTNDAFMMFHSWFLDAMLMKVGYVKYYWEDYEHRQREMFEGLTDDELAQLLAQDGVEPIAASKRQISFMSPQGPVAMEVTDLRVQISTKKGKVCIEVVPPEELLVAARSRHVQVKLAPFVQHRSPKTISEIREMGLKIEDDIADYNESYLEPEVLARRSPEEPFFLQNDGGNEPTTRVVTLKESYLYKDIDGDGIAELIQVIHVGTTVLSIEEVNEIPFSSLSPYPQPHKHTGRSVEELVSDIQELKSMLIRQIVDNTQAGNLGRFAINTARVNLDDFLNGRVNGIVRIDGPVSDNIMPITPSPIAGQAFPLIEMLDGIKENRVGVTRYNQGTDAQSLNKTASGISQIMSAAQEKIELIARIFAETGVKDLFLSVHKLLQKHDKFENVIKLRNEWVTVNPLDWKTRDDMTISVGIGAGNKFQQQQFITQMLMMQEKALPLNIATPKNIYNSLIKLTQLGGFKNYNDYWTSPPDGPMPPSPNPHDAKAQAELQAKQAQLQADAQHKQINLQADAQKFQAQAQIDAQNAEMQRQHELQMKTIEQESLKEIEAIRKQATIEIEQLKAINMPHVSEIHHERDDATAQALQMIAQAMQMISAPKSKTAVLPDGRQIEIHEQVTQ